MVRLLSCACLVFGLAFVVIPPASAQQPAARAYAPENLGPLAVTDRVRVIEREYSDQSRGRQIPDDQLEFYLDQIDSGWGFGQIQQDIATSLRGNNTGNRPPGAGWGGWNGSQWFNQTLICSSINNRRNNCRTPFSGRPALVQNLSGTRCVDGVNFGGGGGTMWVDRGCRGRFTEARGGPGNIIAGPSIRCESVNNRERICPTHFRNRAVLVRQLSGVACIEGRSWSQQRNSIRVTNGCRGEFAESRDIGWGGPNIAYSVTCASINNRRNTCAWDRRQGRPVVIQNLSAIRCQEGFNWGWDGNASLWVDRGCRARFGVR